MTSFLRLYKEVCYLKTMEEDEGIIILGTPRSGTTLLRRLLNAHPQISCPGETFLFRAAAKFLEAEPVSLGFDFGVLGALEELGIEREETLSRLRGFITSFYKDIAAREGKPYWAAKTAIDSFYIDEIEQLFAGRARFICMTRHGLDTVCSMEEFSKDLQAYIAELHAYVAEYSRPLEAFAHAWAYVTSDILDFAAQYSGDSTVIKYEDLVIKPDFVLNKIESFLDIEPFPENISEALGTKVNGYGDWKAYQATQIEDGSIERWKKELPPSMIGQLAPIINPVLAQAGYEPVAAGEDEDAARRQEIARMMMKGE